MLQWSGWWQMFALGLVGMLSWAGQASGQVRGTATYRERLALPPEAVFEATLEDVSKADTPAEVIGRARIERPGNPPIRFEIIYDPAHINPSHRYVVRARILVGGRLFFITDQSYPVLTGGQGNEVALLLRRAGSSDSVGGGAGPLGTLPATCPVPIALAFAISWSCFRTRLFSCGGRISARVMTPVSMTSAAGR
jgi:uncharacterized lipoprotein YbaY